MAAFDLDMADVLPTLQSLIVVTLMASIGIIFFKWVFTRWPVPGVTEFFLAV